VTSFSAQGWTDYAKGFVKSFRKFWPANVRLLCYWEGQCPEGVEEGWNIELLEPCKSFLARYRNDMVVQGKKPSTTARWGAAARANGYGYKYDAYKFARKVFAVAHAARQVEGKLFWLDADVVTHTVFPDWLLHSLLPDHASLCYLARPGYHSELGFVGYNLDRSETHAFITAYEATYSEDIFLSHKYWTDCHIFDDLVAQHKPACELIAHSSHAQPFDRSILGKYMYHLKGKRKNHIREIGRDRKGD
jgi:hypothetical protein